MLRADIGFLDTAVSTPTDGGMLVPHSVEAEQALLGALVIDPSQMIECGYLHSQDFYLTHNRYLWSAMKALFEKHSGYDFVTLTEYLETDGHLADIGGPGALADMINLTPTSYGAPEYASIVYQHSIARQVIDRAMVATQAAYNPAIGRTGDMLVNEVISSFSEIDATRNVSNGPKLLSEGVKALFDEMEEIEESGLVPGLQTGLKTLDHILGGLEKSQLYLLAGRPGMGKSSLALQIAYNVTKRGLPVLYFSLEMSKKAMSRRLVSSVCRIPYDDLKRPGIGDKWPIILDAGNQIANYPLIIDDTPALTVSNMRSIAQKTMMTQPIELIIVDHLGLAKPERPMKDSYHEISQISHSLMAMTKQLNLPVVALSQLSRNVENRADKRPMIADLRDSGKLEEDADGILFLFRDQVYNPDTDYPHLGEINVAKNRGGKLGIATIYADMTTNRFVDLETRSERL